MSAAMAWVPAGKGKHVQVDWARLPKDAAFDAYVCWHDFTGSLWTHCSQKQTRLIVELKDALDLQGLVHLNGRGLRVTPHYISKAARAKYITGVCLDAAALKTFCEATFDGRDPWIARFEVSEGFLNPDAVIAGPAGGTQAWDLLPLPRQLAGPVIGFIDYGCAFVNRQFRARDHSIRTHALWDQQGNVRDGPPSPRRPLAWQRSTRFGYGRNVNAQALTDYAVQFGSLAATLDEGTCYRYAQYEPVLRAATHGTHVMDIATGNPNPLSHHPLNPATQPHEAAIAFVQLPRYRYGQQISGLLKAQVLDAAHFIASLRSKDMPAFINLSYGSYCGPQDGSSILELALDDLVERSGPEEEPSRLHVVVPAGNASTLGGHAQVLVGSLQRQTISWLNMANDPSESFVELWVPEGANVRVRATAAGMTPAIGDWVTKGQALRLDSGGQSVAMLIYSARPCQTVPGQGAMILFATLATSGPSAAPHGLWRIEVENLGSNPVLVDAWCERDDPVFGTEGGPRQCRFESHVERTGTLNSIAHGRRTVVVGGYDVHAGSTVQQPGPVSSMSSSGPGRGLPGRLRHPPDNNGKAKNGPEVLAPCDLGLADPGLPGAAVHSGDQVRMLGTSVAAAAYMRWLVDKVLLPPAAKAAAVAASCPPAIPGRDPHPDDCEPIPRVP
jgi:hypothetical protein